MLSGIQMPKRPFQFSLRMLLLLFVPMGLMAELVVWLLYPSAIDLVITVEPLSLSRYDDHAGHLPLCVSVKITNMSKSTVWFFGYPGSPVHIDQQRVDGKWDSVLYGFSNNDRWTVASQYGVDDYFDVAKF